MMHIPDELPDQLANASDADDLDVQARHSRLVAYLARLVHRGGRVEEQYTCQAVVSMPARGGLRRMLPNVVMATCGVALFLWSDDPFFLLGAGVALLGWHRKLIAGAGRVRLLVRVDDLGEVSTRELGAA